ncbi:unnamed protein product [Closterium sp. NIES-54]
MAPEGKATADSPGPPPATPTAPSAVTSASATLVEQLVARINALESHQTMSIDGSNYAHGVAGLPLPGEDCRVNSERPRSWGSKSWGTGAAGAGGVGSGGAGGVGMEVTLVEDTVASSWRPRPASPPGFPSVP